MSDSTAAYWFESFFPEKLANNPQLSDDIKAKFQFNLDGEGGGTWTVDLLQSPGVVVNGATENPSCTILMSAADFVAMMKKEQNPVALFMSKRLKVEGQMALAMKLQNLIK